MTDLSYKISFQLFEALFFDRHEEKLKLYLYTYVPIEKVRQFLVRYCITSIDAITGGVIITPHQYPHIKYE